MYNRKKVGLPAETKISKSKANSEAIDMSGSWTGGDRTQR